MTNKNIADSLRGVLADSFILYFKTHGFHWNVRGENFHSLHTLFEEQYTEIWNALDDIAERLRALGEDAPSNMTGLLAHAVNLKAADGVPDAHDMVTMLANDNRLIVETLTKCADLADDEDDVATEDLMIQRIRAHEKAAWMLESSRKAA